MKELQKLSAIEAKVNNRSGNVVATYDGKFKVIYSPEFADYNNGCINPHNRYNLQKAAQLVVDKLNNSELNELADILSYELSEFFTEGNLTYHFPIKVTEK